MSAQTSGASCGHPGLQSNEPRVEGQSSSVELTPTPYSLLENSKTTTAALRWNHLTANMADFSVGFEILHHSHNSNWIHCIEPPTDSYLSPHSEEAESHSLFLFHLMYRASSLSKSWPWASLCSSGVPLQGSSTHCSFLSQQMFGDVISSLPCPPRPTP